MCDLGDPRRMPYVRQTIVFTRQLCHLTICRCFIWDRLIFPFWFSYIACKYIHANFVFVWFVEMLVKSKRDAKSGLWHLSLFRGRLLFYRNRHFICYDKLLINWETIYIRLAAIFFRTKLLGTHYVEPYQESCVPPYLLVLITLTSFLPEPQTWQMLD